MRTGLLNTTAHRGLKFFGGFLIAIVALASVAFLLAPLEPVLENAPFPDREPHARLSPNQVAERAAAIDELVALYRKSSDLPPLTPASDEVFLRRLHLQVAGRIPTIGAARTFLDSPNPRKREALIDELLVSEGYVHSFFHFWADLLRHDSRTGQQWVGAEMGEWLKGSLRDNKPYDQFVYELLTAQGPAYLGNPVGYRVRDLDAVEDHAVHTIRAFLGTNIRCAQCHDHPSDEISQLDFYQLLAFFTNTKITKGELHRTRGARYWYGLRRRLSPGTAADRERFHSLRVALSRTYDVAVHTDGPLRLPGDYAYTNAAPGSVVVPSLAIFDGQADLAEDRSRRESLAQWMVSPNNDRFVTTIVHRLWKHTMGGELVPHLDTLDGADWCGQPRLLSHLRSLFVQLDFDVKEFLRIIYYTQLYQSDTRPHRETIDAISARGLTRMSAEQVWDSLIGLAVEDLDERRGYGSAIINTRGKIAQLRRMSMSSVRESQRDSALNASERGRLATHEAPFLLASEKLMESSMWTWDMSGAADPRWDWLPREVVRAAELPSPAWPGHFIQHFGQSTRDLAIEAPHNDPSLQEVFHLLNGSIHQSLWHPQSVLAREAENAADAAAKIDVLFLAVLSRRPDARERQLCLNHFGGDPAIGCRRVAWALINTPEFLFIR